MSLYSKYLCPATGHLEFEITNPDGQYHAGTWNLTDSYQKSSNVRRHEFTNAAGSSFRVYITPRSATSRWGR